MPRKEAENFRVRQPAANVSANKSKPKKEVKEGVIKFSYSLFPAKIPIERISGLMICRDKLYKEGLIGIYKTGPMKGIGYGNASIRATFKGKKGFFITGSQTGGIEKLPAEKYCFIESFSIAENHVKAFGSVAPSSESITHGAIYSINQSVGAVVHTHSREIFEKAGKLGLKFTSKKSSYGSMDLALELKNAIEKMGCPDCGAIVTLGHEDGVFVWHKTIEEASNLCLELLKKAKSI
ncbi:MAG: class II aldolase/adducin family protein [Candidatus Diapherotrites archaeon]